MKDKASQKTEDEVLENTFAAGQTFDGFDEDMTSQSQDGTQSNGSSGKKSGGSSNTILFLAGGVAAITILGYMFVLKPMLSSSTIPAKAPQQAVIPEEVPALPPVVPSAPVAQVATPESRAATDYLLNGNVNPSVPGTPMPVPPVASTGLIPNAPVLPVVPEVSVSNAPSASIVEELGRKFDNQGQQFKVALDDVGSKITNLEKFRDDQQTVNKNVDQRLTKLEEAKPVVGKVHVKSTVSVASPKVVKNYSAKPVKYVRDLRDDNNVLVDKSETKSFKAKETKEVREPAVEYNIHSIYGGRVWLKNADGSLSTYVSGDRLPSGELIKNVDDEKYSISTDKRTFSKK